MIGPSVQTYIGGGLYAEPAGSDLALTIPDTQEGYAVLERRDAEYLYELLGEWLGKEAP